MESAFLLSGIAVGLLLRDALRISIISGLLVPASLLAAAFLDANDGSAASILFASARLYFAGLAGLVLPLLIVLVIAVVKTRFKKASAFATDISKEPAGSQNEPQLTAPPPKEMTVLPS